MHLKTRSLSALEASVTNPHGYSPAGKNSDHAPVAVQCKLRKLEDGVVSGTMLPMPYEKGKVFGVMLPAHTALCYDTTVIRRVLVHEFSHAFLKMQLVLESMYRGEASMKDEFNNLDRSADDLRLGDPSRWFSSEDAESLIHHDDGPSRGALAGCGKMMSF
jgi:hypothetical protein